MRSIPSVFLAFVLGVATGRNLACVGNVQERIGGNFTCELPEYNVERAMDCSFAMDCNTKDLGLQLKAWRCESTCYFVEDEPNADGSYPDIDLDCTFTSTDA